MVKKNKIIIISILVIVVVFSLVKIIFTKKELPYNLVKVEKGSVEQIVSVTGQITPAKKVDLQFEIQGKIERLLNGVGDEVERGDIMASLNKSDLNIQILEARAARDVAQAGLDEILAGASEDEIKTYEIAVENAEIALQNAEGSLKNKTQTLNDIKLQAEENLKQGYEDALNVLDSSWLKIYNTYNEVVLIQRNYFNSYDQESLGVKQGMAEIETAKYEVETYLDKAKIGTREDIESALSNTKKNLNIVFDSLSAVRDICEKAIYRDQVSSTSKTNLDNHKLYINTALANVINSEQEVISTKLANDYDINIAESNVDTAENGFLTAQVDLKEAENGLTKIKSPAQQYELDLVRSKLGQAEAALTKSEWQLTKTNLVSPCDGFITNIKKEEGEVVNQDPVISLACFSEFQIKADIYEEDIVDIIVGNPVSIILPAFPDENLKGEIILIDPAEKLIGGVVYYEVTINIEESKKDIKPGMTADVIIKTGEKENVLVVPKKAVKKMDNKKVVQVFKNNEIEEREVEIGLEGSNDLVEIIFGLEEGEEVIVD